MTAIRRPRNILGIALQLIVAVVAAAWLVPPLGIGGGGVTSGPPEGRTESGLHGEAVIYYLPGGHVEIGIEVRNTTFLPVTLMGLTQDLDRRFLLNHVALVLGTEPNYIGVDDAHTRPFQPVSLAPGATQFIAVVGTFPPCADARPRWSTSSVVGINSLRFDVRVAGVLPAEADVPLLQAVELRGDADAGCP